MYGINNDVRNNRLFTITEICNILIILWHSNYIPKHKLYNY